MTIDFFLFLFLIVNFHCPILIVQEIIVGESGDMYLFNFFVQSPFQINFIKNINGWFVPGIDFVQCAVDHLNLLFKSLMRNIHDVHQNI